MTKKSYSSLKFNHIQPFLSKTIEFKAILSHSQFQIFTSLQGPLVEALHTAGAATAYQCFQL